MSKRFVLLITSVIVGAFLLLSPGIASAPPVAPGEHCETSTFDGWTLEICGAIATAGLGSNTAHVWECRMSLIGTGNVDGGTETVGRARAPIATGIRTCHFFVVGGPQLGPNQRLATPDAVTTVAQNLGLRSTSSNCVILEGFVLFTTTEEPKVGTGGLCEPV